jgi:hypothetical protein
VIAVSDSGWPRPIHLLVWKVTPSETTYTLSR